MILVESITCERMHIESALKDFFKDKKPWKDDFVSMTITETLIKHQVLIILTFKVSDDFLASPDIDWTELVDLH